MGKWLAIAGSVWACDQASKQIVINSLNYLDEVVVFPVFSWVRWHNEGAAFSFLADAGGWQHWFFVVLATGFSIYLLVELYRLEAKDKHLGWFYALILGGALGNLTDRLNHGYVIDFLFFHWEEHGFPAFNIADSSLFCGAALWILMMLLEYRRSRAINGDHLDG